MTARRYPLEPLADLYDSSHELGVAAGCSGATIRSYKSTGVSRDQAERLAVRCGHHPYTVWPEMVDDDIAEVMHHPARERVWGVQFSCPECGREPRPVKVGGPSDDGLSVSGLVECPAGHQFELTVQLTVAAADPAAGLAHDLSRDPVGVDA